MDPFRHGLISPEPGPGREGLFVVHGDGFCGEFDEELRDLRLRCVVCNDVDVAVVVAIAVVVAVVIVVLGLALVAGEGFFAANVTRAARVDPDAALVAFDHLLAVVEGDAADAVDGPGAVAPLVGRVGTLRAVRSPPFHSGGD